ncbi:MAG TPA: DUF2442 domain-containing protein [Rubricoccaceae bacterium]|nr:DUF2442 domain-containing protein [Rubricoccaceae bacterium]
MPTISLLYLTVVQHVRDYVLEVTFNDGSVREMDLADELYGPVFEPLRDPELFAQVYLDEETRTVTWPNGADLSPEFLHEVGRLVAPAE